MSDLCRETHNPKMLELLFHMFDFFMVLSLMTGVGVSIYIVRFIYMVIAYPDGWWKTVKTTQMMYFDKYLNAQDIQGYNRASFAVWCYVSDSWKFLAKAERGKNYRIEAELPVGVRKLYDSGPFDTAARALKEHMGFRRSPSYTPLFYTWIPGSKTVIIHCRSAYATYDTDKVRWTVPAHTNVIYDQDLKDLLASFSPTSLDRCKEDKLYL